MFIVAEEDIAKLKDVIGNVLLSLVTGAKRVDFDLDLGDQLPSLGVCGYWAGNVMRIDIKVKE